jgi:hypothetical protein
MHILLEYKFQNKKLNKNNCFIDILSQKLYNICDRGDIVSETKDKILYRINEKNYGAFTTSDFIDIDNYKTISKALERLEDEKLILRVRRGVYCLRKYNDILGMEESPNINEVAKAIARQLNIIIIPSGNYSLNIVGLSTQVPSKYVYITNGPYNEYDIGANKIFFKHSTSREIYDLPYRILVAIQCLKIIGKENVCNKDLEKISSFLSEDDKNYIKNNNLRIISWIYYELKKVGEM